MSFLSTRDDDGTQPDWEFFILAIVLTSISIFFIVARLLIRYQYPGLHLEDWLIVAAVILDIMASVFDCLAVESGMGIHNALLTAEQLIVINRYYYIATLPYKFSIGLTKLSILCLYHRVFVHRTFQIVCIGLAIYVALFSLSTGIVTVFQCRPIARMWDKSIDGWCVQPTAQWYSFAAFNISAELVLFFLPMPMIKRLQLPRQQKVGLFIIFCVGFFVIFSSIFRLVVTGTQNKPTDTNFTWSNGNRWTTIELNVGVICACIPTLKGPFSRIAYFLGSLVPTQGSSYAMRSIGGIKHNMSKKGNTMPRKQFHQFDLISEVDTTKGQDGITKTVTVGVEFDRESATRTDDAESSKTRFDEPHVEPLIAEKTP